MTAFDPMQMPQTQQRVAEMRAMRSSSEAQT